MTYNLSVDGKETTCGIEGTKICLKDSNGITVNIDGLDIIAVEEIQSSDKNVSNFNLHYINKSKEPKWRKRTMRFRGDSGICDKLIPEMKELMDKVTLRPKRLLVLINPVGGKQAGVKSYSNIVAPLFELANITTEVMVSERPKHIFEIMETYDVSQIDGIVLCGGDGTYHECISMLLKRFQREAGIDINDNTSQIIPLKVPIGMVPTGTGNVLAASSYGCRDIETAALHILRGHKKKRSITGYYDGGKLLGYAGQSFSYGMFTDMLYDMNTNRWLKSVKKIVVPLYHVLFKRFRQFTAEVTFFRRNHKDKEGENKETQGAELIEKSDAISENQESSVTVRGSFITLAVFIDDMFDEQFNMHARLLDDMPDHTTLSLYKPCSHFQLSKHFVKIATLDPASFQFDFHQNYKMTSCKFKLLREVKSETDQTPAIDIRERLMALDGEIVEIPRPEFECIWYKDIITNFAS